MTRITRIFFLTGFLSFSMALTDTIGQEVTLSSSHSNNQKFDSELFKKDHEIRESKNPILAYNTGVEQFDVRNFRIAEYFLNQAVELDPYFAEAYLFLSRIKIRERKFAEARDFGLKAVKYNEDLVAAHLDLFLIYSRLQNKADAHKHLLTAAKLDPETVSRTASRLITDQDDLYGALFFFEKVHTVAPTNLLNALNYAKALMIAKRNAHAEKILEIAYQANSFEEEHFQLLYRMYFAKLIQHEKYRFAIELASEKVPDSFQSQYLFKALSFYKMGDQQQFEENAKLYFIYTNMEAPTSLVAWAQTECSAMRK